MTSAVLSFGALLLSIGCCYETRRLAANLRAYVNDYEKLDPSPEALPKVLVVVPCKGIPNELPDLEDNLRSILNQDYPSFRVIFAIGDEHDIAKPTIDTLCEEHPHARLVVAEHREGQSQKIANQLRALQEREDTDGAIAFFDSDARPHPLTLKKLIAPLTRDRQTGATTGYRWYTPQAGGFGSWLRATWNAGGMPFMIEPQLNYAWGGAMAIRTDTFDDCGVKEFWTTALSDDLGLSLVVKRKGYTIHYVPDCIVHSPEDLTLPQTIEWTSRQTVICRVYNEPMWKHILVGEGLTALTLLAGLIGALIGFLTGSNIASISGLVACGIVLASRVKYQQSISAVTQQIQPDLLTRKIHIHFLVLSLLINPLMLYNSIRSWVSRRITWRGIKYTLHAPQHIEVCKS